MTARASGDDALPRDRRRPEAEYLVRAWEEAARVVRGIPLRKDTPWIEMWAGHVIYVREAERAATSAGYPESLGTAGSAQEICARIHTFGQAGVNQVVVSVLPGLEAEMERFAAEVMTPYRAAS